MQLTTEASVNGRRADSLLAGITILYFGPKLLMDSTATFSPPFLKPCLTFSPATKTCRRGTISRNGSGHHKWRRVLLACSICNRVFSAKLLRRKGPNSQRSLNFRPRLGRIRLFCERRLEDMTK